MQSRIRTIRFDEATDGQLKRLAEAQGHRDLSEVVRKAIQHYFTTYFPSDLAAKEEGPTKPSQPKSIAEILLSDDSAENAISRTIISTGSNSLDSICGRSLQGIESGAITHVYGLSGVGKTQMAVSLAVNASKLGKVLYIDTERGRNLTSRFKQISDYRQGLLENIAFVRASNAQDLESNVDTFWTSETIGNHKREEFKLLVVDSISSLYRDEMAGNRNTQQRNMAISSLMSRLANIAEKYNIAVFVTNQVYKDIGGFGPELRPYAENAIRSKAFITIYLRMGGNIRVAKLISSVVDEAMMDAPFTIDNTGVRDS
jgi:RecA/RadA recombinase